MVFKHDPVTGAWEGPSIRLDVEHASAALLAHEDAHALVFYFDGDADYGHTRGEVWRAVDGP